MPEYRVLLSIRQFDGSLGGTVVLDARWTVITSDHKESMNSGRSLIREATGSADHEALVVAQSRALEAMSREIAAEISKLISAAN